MKRPAPESAVVPDGPNSGSVEAWRRFMVNRQQSHGSEGAPLSTVATKAPVVRPAGTFGRSP